MHITTMSTAGRGDDFHAAAFCDRKGCSWRGDWHHLTDDGSYETATAAFAAARAHEQEMNSVPDDSRVTRLLACFTAPNHDDRAYVTGLIEGMEAAGLLVVDPQDEVTVERVARKLAAHNARYSFQLEMTVDEYVDKFWPACVTQARAVLAALRGDDA